MLLIKNSRYFFARWTPPAYSVSDLGRPCDVPAVRPCCDDMWAGMAQTRLTVGLPASQTLVDPDGVLAVIVVVLSRAV
jgi:hypothetical protein